MSTQFIKNPFTSRFCEQMNVPGTHDRQVASYLIGTPNPSSITNPGFMAVCKSCAISIVENLPDELLEFVDADRVLTQMSTEQRIDLFERFSPAEDDAAPSNDTATPADDDDLKCPYCDYIGTTPAGLRGHIGGKHGGVKSR